MPDLMAVLCLGILVGSVLGLTGAGGGVLAVPALVLGLGWSLTEAAPVALLAVGLAAAVGAYLALRQQQVRYKAALLMALAGSVCAPIGVTLAKQLPYTVLVSMFATVMVLAALRLIRSAQDVIDPADNVPCRMNPETGRLRWTPVSATLLAAVGGAAGIGAGMLGVGGGFIVVPALRQWSDIPQHHVRATSLMVIALISVGTIASQLWHGTTLHAGSAGFVGGAIAGLFIGRALAGRLPERVLQLGFATLMLLVAASLLLRVF